MVPIDPRLLNPSSRDIPPSTTVGPSNPGGGAGKQVQPSSASPASTPSSQGHGMSLNPSNDPTKRLGGYVSRQRPSAPRSTVSYSSGSSTAAAAASGSLSAEGGVVSPTATTSSDESRLNLQDARSSQPTIQFGTYTGSDTSFDDSESLG
ncbi:hypothetical protein V8E36_002558 [Tilletia maclaganii]